MLWLERWRSHSENQRYERMRRGAEQQTMGDCLVHLFEDRASVVIQPTLNSNQQRTFVRMSWYYAALSSRSALIERCFADFQPDCPSRTVRPLAIVARARASFFRR